MCLFATVIGGPYVKYRFNEWVLNVDEFYGSVYWAHTCTIIGTVNLYCYTISQVNYITP